MPATPSISLNSISAHDLAGKPVPILPDHASALCEWHGDEARLSAALHAQQHDVLCVVLCGRDRITHVTGTCDRLAGDLENDVAFLEAALGGRALRIDLGHDDAFLAGAGDAVGGSNRQTELRYVGAARLLALVVVVV